MDPKHPYLAGANLPDLMETATTSDVETPANTIAPEGTSLKNGRVAEFAERLLSDRLAGKTVKIDLPRGTYRDRKKFLIPSFLRIRIGEHIPCEVMSAARLMRAIELYNDCPDPVNLLKVREEAGVLERNLLQALSYRQEAIVKMRDGENISSMYGAGLPGWNRFYFKDGKLWLGKPWEVVLGPQTAARMGVVEGEKVIIVRQPITGLLALQVKIDNNWPEGVIGLYGGVIKFEDFDEPITVPGRLGGDYDGDKYFVVRFHTLECIAEIDAMFKAIWEDQKWEVVDEFGPLYTYKDHVSKGRSDTDIAMDKFQQKDATPRSTLVPEMIAAAKTINKHIPGSFFEALFAKFRAIETAMDMKQGTGQNPTLFADILEGKEKYDEADRAQLIEQGFKSEYVDDLMAFLASKGKTMKQLAAWNWAWNSFRNGSPAVRERLVDTLKCYQNPADVYVNELLGWYTVKQAEYPRSWEKTPRVGQEYGEKFSAKWNAETQQIEVKCGLATFVQETEEDGKIVKLSDTKKVLFRPTVRVELDVTYQRDPKTDRSSATKCKVIKHGDKAVRLISDWGALLNEMVRAETWIEGSIRRELDPAEAERLLAESVRGLLGDLLSTYRADGDLKSWSVIAGVHKYVVLVDEIPASTHIEVEKVKQSIKDAAGNFLLRHKLINSLCDTISSDPGMAYWANVAVEFEGKNGKWIDTLCTFVTQFDPMRRHIAPKRYPVTNALGNGMELKFPGDVSFNHPVAVVRPDQVELWACAARLNGDGAFWISKSAAAKFIILIPKPGGGYVEHPLQSGDKLQAFSDIKGLVLVVDDELMPIIEFADGSQVRAEVAFDMASINHEMLPHTHHTLVLTAAAYTRYQATGKKLTVDPRVTLEQVRELAVSTGLYENEDMVAWMLGPDGVAIEQVPAGRMAFVAHRQVNAMDATVHGRTERRDDYNPTTLKEGGMSWGLAGVYALMAYGMNNCLKEIFGKVHPKLADEFKALVQSIEKDPEWDEIPVNLKETGAEIREDADVICMN